MKSIFLSSVVLYCFTNVTLNAQKKNMTPELLLEIKRVAPVGLTKDLKNVVFSVTQHNTSKNTKDRKYYLLALSGGEKKEIKKISKYIRNKAVSPDGQQKIVLKKVKLKKVLGKDYYPTLKKSNVKIYNDLHYRHWDKWLEGKYDHLIIKSINDKNEKGIDVMKGEPYFCPQLPFGGKKDYTWNPEGSKIIYVAKKKVGKGYVLSTNTDIFEYDLTTKNTRNLTKGMPGYDMQPAFSPDGKTLAFLSMARDGYESDKNDLIILQQDKKINLTRDWDGTINSFKWSNDGQKIYFNAPVNGTVQLFEIDYDSKNHQNASVKQLTNGNFDIRSLVGQSSNNFIVTRTDMNHAAELYSVDLTSGKMKQLSFVNRASYEKIKMSPIKRRVIPTTDGKKMLAWVVYPPDFDSSKKYPTLLYCQGGPQSALTQFYSFRWNFQLMAAHGYIVIAPNRRGMPGQGVKWNEEISKDWGGHAMKDYLSAIDDISKETYVDKKRLGAIGASFGGYSVYYLAGVHHKRFKTFIAHDGVFDLRSMYGTTEEMWFPNWDLGGAYWEKNNALAMKSYREFNPVNLVGKWDAPIMIIQGGRDYRVPIGQGLAAFQAAQLRGIKSRLLYFPKENHWVLDPQNSIIWHKEFYKWLEETL